MDTPFEFNEHIDQIYLDKKEPLVDTTCQASGWSTLLNYLEGERIQQFFEECIWRATPNVHPEGGNLSATPIYIGAIVHCFDLQWTEVQIKSGDECSKTYQNADVNYDSLAMICGVST